MREILSDLVAEQQSVDQFLQRIRERDWKLPTPAPGWSIHDTVSHLAYTETFAAEAIEHGQKFVDDAQDSKLGEFDTDAFERALEEMTADDSQPGTETPPESGIRQEAWEEEGGQEPEPEELDTAAFEAALDGNVCLATELADLLVDSDVPFREAHGIVGRIVLWCEERGTDLRGLTPDAARGFHPALDIDLSPWLDARAATERRTSRGGTAWAEVQRQVELLRAGPDHGTR